MASKKKAEYAMFIRAVSRNGADTVTGAVSTDSFFATMEEHYPSGAGWEVYNSVFLEQTPEGYVMCYFLKKVNE